MLSFQKYLKTVEILIMSTVVDLDLDVSLSFGFLTTTGREDIIGKTVWTFLKFSKFYKALKVEAFDVLNVVQKCGT